MGQGGAAGPLILSRDPPGVLCVPVVWGGVCVYGGERGAGCGRRQLSKQRPGARPRRGRLCNWQGLLFKKQEMTFSHSLASLHESRSSGHGTLRGERGASRAGAAGRVGKQACPTLLSSSAIPGLYLDFSPKPPCSTLLGTERERPPHPHPVVCLPHPQFPTSPAAAPLPVPHT